MTNKTEALSSAPTLSVLSSLSGRLDSIDLLRGIVMVFMLLDHTSDFVTRDVLNFSPTDPTRTNVAFYFTRWVTHFCAPVFVFLAGTGSFFYGARGRSKSELSTFLITRGLWLIFLELTIFRVIIWFNVDFRFAAMFQVIWAIGVSLIILAFLIRLPLKYIAAFGIGMIALHNLLDLVQIPPTEFASVPTKFWIAIWLIFHQAGIIFFTTDVYAFVVYPLIPWIGVTAAGYAFGALYLKSSEDRRRIFLKIGYASIIAFIVIRATRLYGDPILWSQQKNLLYTVLSFLNVLKYPPSLLFLLITLGPAILFLAWRDGKDHSGIINEALITFGRVPLFFYALQWIMSHGLAILVSYIAGKPVGWLLGTILDRPSPNPGNLGFDLWVTWVLWILGVVLLYPACRWFAGVKQRRREWWLSYL